MNIRIDPEFESRIPPLTDDEYQQLEENILSDGVVINPIIVWNGIIVDGHNRFRILEKHPHIQYTVYEKSFDDRFAVLAWICKNQLGRRNLTQQQKKYLIGKQYEAEKATNSAARGFRGNQYAKVASSHRGNLPNSLKTCERIAKENGISKNTVLRSAAYAKAIDYADEIEPGIRSDILSGNIKATVKDVEDIIHATPVAREQLVGKLRDPPKTKRKKRTGGGARMEEISESLSKPRERATQADMFYEFDDAFKDFTFRWNMCMSANADYLADEDCYAQFQQRIQAGFDYLNQIMNGGTHNGKHTQYLL